MTDRTLPWGDPPNQNYTTGEGGSDTPDGNFVVAETSAGLKLMEWDATATEWVVRGDVNASGQAVTVNSLDAASVSTENAQVTEDSFVRATRSSDSASTSAGSFIKVFDGADKGSLSNGEFSPTRSGEYFISVSARVKGSTNKNDLIRLQVKNASSGTQVSPEQQGLTTGADGIFTATTVANLSAGEDYEILLTNNDTSFIIDGDGGTVSLSTSGHIVWSVVQ